MFTRDGRVYARTREKGVKSVKNKKKSTVVSCRKSRFFL